MTDSDLIFETTRPEQADFNKLVANRIGATTAAAVIAKEIILASKKFGYKVDVISKAVDGCIREILEAGIEIPPAKNFGEE